MSENKEILLKKNIEPIKPCSYYFNRMLSLI